MNDADSAPSPNRFWRRFGIRAAALNASAAPVVPRKAAMTEFRMTPNILVAKIPSATKSAPASRLVGGDDSDGVGSSAADGGVPVEGGAITRRLDSVKFAAGSSMRRCRRRRELADTKHAIGVNARRCEHALHQRPVIARDERDKADRALLAN